ncbi:tail fiber domain-containing protein [Flavisolibacter tropicus]|nr:tail fiber domain-containing protein [Flavisolibacter tropicus]
MKTTFLSLLTVFCVIGGFAQVGIGVAVPHSSAQLEIVSPNKGLLIPRVSSVNRPTPSPAVAAKGLLIYQTDGQEGFYYWDGAAWQPLGSGWRLNGNGGTTSTNFLGTLDNQPLRFRTSNTHSGFISNTNIGLGLESLSEASSGGGNTALGAYAMQNNTTGGFNSALGNQALVKNTTGNFNTAVGLGSLGNNQTGSRNVSLGGLQQNIDGNDNTAVGLSALNVNASGSFNTALGNGAGPDIGFNALSKTTAIGYNAKVTRSNSLILGGTGLDAVQVGIGVTAPHTNALVDMTSLDKGLLIPRVSAFIRPTPSPAAPADGLLIYQTNGAERGFNYWDGNTATWKQLSGWGLEGSSAPATSFIGTTNAQDLNFKVSNQASGKIGANGDIGLGLGSLAANTGTQVTAFGYNTLSKNSASANTALGYSALANNTSASSNTAVGYLALNANNAPSASGNTAIGTYSLSTNTAGSNNTALGGETLLNSKTGSRNTALGYRALNASDNGSDNTAVGNNALLTAAATSFNTALGSNALRLHATGSSNTAVGYNAMRNFDNNNFNTAIGYNADVNQAGLTNATAIGNGAIVTASNTIQLGNSSVSQVVTAGDVVSKGSTLISDRRFKSQIRTDVKGLNFIMALQPVTYLFDNQKLADYRDGKIKTSELNSYVSQTSYKEEDLERRTGFIAQQVEQAAKQVGYAFDGVRVPKNENDIYTLSYSTFVVPLVKAVQEQQTEIESLQEKLKKSEEDKKEQLQKITALQNNEQQLFERLKKLEAKIR